jgi:hypothetical protein
MIIELFINLVRSLRVSFTILIGILYHLIDLLHVSSSLLKVRLVVDVSQSRLVLVNLLFSRLSDSDHSVDKLLLSRSKIIFLQ